MWSDIVGALGFDFRPTNGSKVKSKFGAITMNDNGVSMKGTKVENMYLFKINEVSNSDYFYV